MLKIGDFSRLSRISIRMLRYYDVQGVLKPSHIDENSGYRQYSNAQLRTATHICFLRDLGFSVAEIKDLLTYMTDSDKLQLALLKKRTEVQEELKEVNRKVILLKNAEELLKKENMMMKYEVEVKQIAGGYMMCKRGLIPSYDKEHLLWEGLFAELQARQLHVQMDTAQGTRAYFYDEGYAEKDPDVEVAVPVIGTYEDSENLTFKTYPETKCACVHFTGSYGQLNDIHHTVSDWISKRGYTLDGANFCIYHVGPGSCNNPDEYVTDVCFPIR